jgi:hypothetical protein
LVIPWLQPGDNVIPRPVDFLNTANGWGAFSTFILQYPKSVVHLKEKKIIPWGRGTPSQKLYLKNGTVEFFLTEGDAFSTFKLPKISRLFGRNLSPGVGITSSQKPSIQEWHSRFFF